MAHIKKPNESNKPNTKQNFGHKLKSLIDNSANGMEKLRQKMVGKRGK